MQSHTPRRVFHKLLYTQKKNPPLQSHSLSPGGAGGGGSSTAGSSASSREASQEEDRPSQTVTGTSSSATTSDKPVDLKESRKLSRSKKFKDASKDMKLKLFLKRGSEPILNGLPTNQQQVSNSCTVMSSWLQLCSRSYFQKRSITQSSSFAQLRL